jgi:hypothetical protein
MANKLDDELSHLDEPFTQEEIDRMIVSGELDSFLEADGDFEVDDTDFKPFYPHWKKLVAESKLKERTPVKIHDVVKLKLNGKVNREDPTKHRDPSYVDPAKFVKDELTESTILWYPIDPNQKSKKPEDKQPKLMALYLKGVIPIEARTKALEGLKAMSFEDPIRAETENAIKFNGPEAKVRAGELPFGFMDRGTVTKTIPTREQIDAFRKLKDIVCEMNTRYARTTPVAFGDQNRPLAGQHTTDGGINEEFRNFGTAFSTFSVLKSCPAAVHVDRGNGQGYSVLSGVRGTDFEGGGNFCLIEYGIEIPMEPGDLLIGATMREWHCNLTPVRGTKYSIICYYRRGLGSIKRREGWAKKLAKEQEKP